VSKKVYALWQVDYDKCDGSSYSLIGVFDNPERLVEVANEELEELKKKDNGIYYIEVWEYELNKKWDLRNWRLSEFVKELGDK